MGVGWGAVRMNADGVAALAVGGYLRASKDRLKGAEFAWESAEAGL